MVERESSKIIIEQLSQDLEDLENYLKDLWQFLPLPTLYTNPLFTILDVNLALEKLLGVKGTDLIGKNVEIFFNEESTCERILKELREKKKITGKEIKMRTWEGEKFFVVFASSRQDQDGNIIGYYFSFSDITSLKELQEKLEEKVKKRTQDLQERVEELEKFHKLTVGRELKMLELKAEIEKLKAEIEKLKKEKKENL